MNENPRKCPCRFQLPLQYNDGEEVEPEVLGEIFSALDRQFGGWHPLGTSEGSWGGQVEPMMTVEVAVDERRIPELRQVVYAIGHRLRQEEMYFDAPPPTVEFIKIDGKPSSMDGQKGKREAKGKEGA